MAGKKNIEPIVRELKELQSLCDALVVCDPLPQSLLMLIRDKAQRVAVLAGQEIEPADSEQAASPVKMEEDAVPSNNDNEVFVLNDNPAKADLSEMKIGVPAVDVVSNVDYETQSEQKAGLAQKLTLNERFRFLRNLFMGNDALMSSVLDELDGVSGLQEREQYLKARFEWDWESAPVLDFFDFLERNTI